MPFAMAFLPLNDVATMFKMGESVTRIRTTQKTAMHSWNTLSFLSYTEFIT